jgi:hypothetical protein
VINTGLILERSKREWSAVRKVVISLGEGAVASAKMAFNAEIDGELRVRLNVSRIDDEKPLEEEAGVGDEGAEVCELVEGIGVRVGLEAATLVELDAGFFFPENGRKKDQSDSNLTESKSEPVGKCLSKAESIS